MGGMKAYLHALRSRGEEESTPCPECRRPTRNGYCFYCGAGKRRKKTAAQRAADEARALELWAECQSLTGTLAEQYLRRERKITLPLPEAVLRFHPRCPFDHRQYVPALVALLHAVADDGRPCGIHRTPLTFAGAKAGVPRTYGTFGRTAIKLWPEPVAGKLTIGEGIETTLSAVQLNPQLAPAWAVGTADNLGMFPILDAVTHLHILVDNDPEENGRVGQVKAKQCAGRYAAWAKHATRYTPNEPFKDFNDVLRAMGATNE
jgi:hypothetical protein